MDVESIKKYYSDTQFEYGLMWNWMLKATPALHFGYYDDVATTHKQAVVRANEVLSQYADLKQGARIVDAGCGLGHSSEWLANNVGAIVTGITIVPKQVQTIRKRLQKKPVSNVDFMLADYLKMPFADASIDVVWAFESVCHAPEKLLFYKEAYRVLKPGGKLVLAEYLRNDRPLNTDKEQLLSEVFAAWAIKDLDTLAEHQAHATKAGFNTFRNRNVTENVAASYRNLRATCKRYSGLSKVFYKAGLISFVRHQNVLGSAKQADALEQGVFSYHHIVATK